MREKTEAEGVVEMFNYMYDNYKECGYETLKDAIMAESNRVIAVELAKLNDRFAEALNGEGGKPKDMCEVLDRVEAKGKQEGIKEGRFSTTQSALCGLKSEIMHDLWSKSLILARKPNRTK